MSEYVASLELSKELYRLSGWGNDYEDGFVFMSEWYVNADDLMRIAPKYELSFMLRKLPRPFMLGTAPTNAWEVKCQYITDTMPPNTISESAGNPEDAACKLLIKLIKQGVVKL